MNRIYFVFLFLFTFTFISFSQSKEILEITKVVDSLDYRLKNAEQIANKNLLNLNNATNKIDTLLNVISTSEKSFLSKSSDVFSTASLIVKFVAMVFGAVTIIFLIAGVLGFREISNIKGVREKMNELRQSMERELLKTQEIKIEIKNELKSFKDAESLNIEQIKKDIYNSIEEIKLKSESERAAYLKTMYLLNEGMENYHSGRLQNAAKRFIKILEINKNDYDATCFLARTYFGLNDFDKGLEMIQKAVTLSEKPRDAYYIMAENYRRIGQYSESIDAFMKSSKLEERDATYASLGYTYFKMNDYENSIKSFLQAISIRRYSTPICGLAKSLIKTKELERAKNYFAEVINIAEEEISSGTNYVWPFYNCAFGYLFNNNKEKCFEYLNIALNKNTNPTVIKEIMEDYKVMIDEPLPQELLKECISLFREKILT